MSCRFLFCPLLRVQGKSQISLHHATEGVLVGAPGVGQDLMQFVAKDGRARPDVSAGVGLASPCERRNGAGVEGERGTMPRRQTIRDDLNAGTSSFMSTTRTWRFGRRPRDIRAQRHA